MFYGFVTVENLMFLGAGFLLAWLTALPVFPAVHERAVRLTRKKLEVEPLSMREMQTEKDTLRADFAMSTRQLERRIENLNGKYVADVSALARKNGAIVSLKDTIDGRDGFIARLQAREMEIEAREQRAAAERDAAKAEAAARTQALHDAETRAADLSAELAALTAALNRRIDMYNVQQHALMTLQGERGLPDFPSEIVVPQHNGNGHAKPAPQPIRLPEIAPLAPIASAPPFAGERDAIRRALESVLADGTGVAPM